MYRGGVRSFRRTLADGKEHDLYYKARMPNELAAHFGAMSALKEDNEKDTVARQKLIARFIADSMCDADGKPLMTLSEAELIPAPLKIELRAAILEGSSEAGEAGKD